MFSNRMFVAWVAVCALAPSLEALAENTSFVMASYVDSPGGPQIAARDYAGAIAAASRPGARRGDAVVAATNLCVAHTVSGDVAAAASACDEAVSLTKHAAAARRADAPFAADRALAQALSNRGVLRAMSGDAGGAESDFREAVKHRGAWAAAARNLEHLQTSPARGIARADADR